MLLENKRLPSSHLKLNYLKPLYVIAAALLYISLSSCQKHFYAPAIYQNDVLYMQKPHSKDSVKTAIYATGSYLTQENSNSNGTLQSGVLNIYRSHTIPNFNLSYGLLGFAGSYTKDSKDNYMTTNTKSFTGLGINTSVSYYKNYDHLDWRVVGVDMV